MIVKKKIMKLVAKVNEAGLNDVLAGAYYDQIINTLGDDLNEILYFLESLDDETLYEISSVFGELSLKFDTQEFANKLLKLEAKATQAVTRGFKQPED